MATPFENFVNDELPKRPSTRQSPLTLEGGKLAVSTGTGLEVEFRNPADFIADGKSAYDLAVEGGFVGTVQEWLQSLVGPQGKSAYEVAKEDGFEGTAEAWLESLKGQDAYQLAVQGGFQGTLPQWLASLKGDKGERGEQGLPATLLVKGYLDSTAQLPDPSELENGTAYYIEKHIWVVYGGAWVDAGDQSGPAGQDGIGIRILGTLPVITWLPTTGNNSGDAYIINYKMYVWDSERWSPVGQVGPQGMSAYQVAQQQGFTGTVNQWLASLVGRTNYQIARANGFVGSEGDWLATLVGPKGDTGQKGDKGDKGDAGSSAAIVILKGAVASVGDLPTDAAVSDAYLIGTNLYVWIGESWANVGNVVGPQGLKGDKGDKGDTGNRGAVGMSAYELATALGFIGTQEEWIASLVGSDGRSAYDIAVAHGFVGSEAAWVESLKGVEGEQGPRGLPGTGLTVKGKVTTPSQLPSSPAADECWVVDRNIYCYIDGAWVDLGLWVGDKGDTGPEGPPGPPLDYKGALASEAEMQAIPNPKKGYYVSIGKHLWTYTGTAWADLGDFSGPAGAKGEKGDKGADGERGPEGLIGTGLRAMGSLDSVADLNDLVDPQDGDVYMIQGHLHVRSGPNWLDWGDLKGERGEQGIQGDKGEDGPPGAPMVPKGHLNSNTDLPAASAAGAGATYMVGNGEVYISDGTAWVFMGVIVGPEGPEGPMGPGITILGRLNSSSELPGTGQLGQGYLIGVDFWGWTGAAFENLGQIQGPKGDQGPQGKQGIQGVQGNKGDKGDQGTLWIVLGRDPQPIDGRIGDYFLNSSTLQFFLKTTGVLWAPLGYMGGGNVYDAPTDSNEYSRIDGGWKKIDVLEALKDGKMYGRQNGTWVEMVIPVGEAPKDGKGYVRKDGAWSETMADAPDSELYLRKQGAWAKLDRYTLKIAAATSILDLSDRQTFTVDASVNRTLTFSNPPGAGRSMTVVVTVAGNAGQINWPPGVQWNAGTAPVLGATFTVVVMFWNGTTWYGSTGATA